MGDAANCVPLLAAADDAATSVRVAAIEALGHLRCTQIENRVAEWLSDDDFSVRAEAVKAIASLGDPRLRPLAEAALQREKDLIARYGMKLALDRWKA
jgi:HEAT repeat protein